MTRVSIGDMAQGHMLRIHNQRMKEQMGTLIDEMASGRTADISRHLTGSYAYLSDVERKLTILEGYATATAEAQVLTSAMQDALELFQSFGQDLGLAAVAATSTHVPEAVAHVSQRAQGDFARMVSALNTDTGGRAIFSGTATDRAPLADPEVILADLRLALAGQTTAGGVQAVVDAWFDDPGGGFETLGYTGGADTLAPLAVADGETLALTIKADDSVFRDQLKQAAVIALASDATLGFDVELQRDIVKTAAETLAFRQDALTGLRGTLGQAETRVDDTLARIGAEQVSYQMARTELLSVDPYETASRLEDVQYQLEALYSVTVRLSRLSMLEFMR